MTLITKDPKHAAEFLKKGSVVALPTETVYGLGASIYHDEALDEIFRLKNRPSDNPLIVHCLDLAMVEKIAFINSDYLKLYHAFMPGPLSVLLAKKQVSDRVTRGLKTVCVRLPSHPLFCEVLKHLDEPIAAPSANLSGKPSATNALHVFDDFSPNLPLILDGGPCDCGIESTIIKLEDDHAVILRPGAIDRNDLERVLNKPVILAQKEAPLQAPGMKYRHYAPKAKVILIEETSQLPIDLAHHMVIARDSINCPFFEKLSERNLYAAFRKADQLNLDKIYIIVPKTLSEGLKNRIEKAAH